MRPGTMGHATGGRKRLDLSPPAGRPSAGGRSRDRHRRRGATVRRGRPPPHHTTPHHNTAAHSSIRLVSATATATVKAVAMMRWRRTVRFFLLVAFLFWLLLHPFIQSNGLCVGGDAVV